jgi:hypothetical protein
MKIDQLPLGARFQWKGHTYTKVGPMTASGESGGAVFIPMHAVLQPVPGEAPPSAQPDPAGRQLDAARVTAAFETYHQAALTLADEAGRAMLEAARKRFLSGIG